MKVGGGLNYVTGPMGSGKSLYGVRRITEYVCAGQYVVTNVRLYPDAFEKIARHVARGSLMRRGSRSRTELARRLESRYVFEESLTEAMRYRVPGKGEARALFVWDETHNDLNNRSWRDDGRAQILEWATQLRKLGFVGFLLSQHSDNTDAALRRVCNWQIRLQNQREAARVLGVRATPWPLFLAFWYATNVPQGSKVKPERTERYFLSWHRNLYDTHDLFHGLADSDADGGAIYLPTDPTMREGRGYEPSPLAVSNPPIAAADALP